MAIHDPRGNVIIARVIKIREALEETKAHGIRFKAPKTKAGRRDVTLPDFLVETLRGLPKRAVGNSAQAWCRKAAGRRPIVCAL
jgi:hypothetical protein